MNQQSQQNTFSQNTQDITSWLKGVKDPTVLSHVVREAIGQIDQLDPSARQQVYTQLRNDVKFSSAMSNFSPQTA